ncbi:inositol-polyphosphate multikinase [Microdochium nivale]|nr:inositol-polyphosphate multikinase [Microdochium nivale]
MLSNTRDANGRSLSAKERDMPKQDDLVEYNFAVAGHAGTMSDADGELFIKPCTKAEVNFYETAHANHPDFCDIMPLYIGTLILNDDTSEAQIHAQIPGLVEHADIPTAIKHEIQSHLHLDNRAAFYPPPTEPPTKPLVKVESKPHHTQEPTPASKVEWKPKEGKTRKIDTDRAVVLENASFGFQHPNIMDAKLGLRLWADDAPQAKKERFDKIADETTHKNYGFRVAGMRTWNGSSDPKELDPQKYRIYDKDWGRLTVNDDNIIEKIGSFIFNKEAGIDADLGKTVAGLFAEDLRRVQSILEQHESRMYSASLLFVFEGDGQALRAAIAEAKKETDAERATLQATDFSCRIDSGIGMGDQDSAQAGQCYDDDDDDEDEDFSTFPKIYSLRLIDFAHARFVPGQGPDENILFGVRGLLKIFEKLAE